MGRRIEHRRRDQVRRGAEVRGVGLVLRRVRAVELAGEAGQRIADTGEPQEDPSSATPPASAREYDPSQYWRKSLLRSLHGSFQS